MRTHTTTIVVAAALLLAALTACGTEPAPDKPAAGPVPSTATQSPTLSTEDTDEAGEAAELPPSPDAATRTAYLAALDGIDADIVHGKNDKAISRGRITCADLKRYPGDKAKQVQTATKRWSSPTHPEGRTPAVAEDILEASHKHLCPDF